ncbi:MAG: hypothetical protein QW533_01270 [Thermoplasmata archaeon]
MPLWQIDHADASFNIVLRQVFEKSINKLHRDKTYEQILMHPKKRLYEQ